MFAFVYGIGGELDSRHRSKFGEADDIADLTCVIDGLQRALPEAKVVSTATFWETVAPATPRLALAQLLKPPWSTRLASLELDYLVVAYHQIADKKSGLVVIIGQAVLVNEDLETAAVIAVDLRKRQVTHASRAIFEDDDTAGLLLVIPIVIDTIATSDPCEMIGTQAGAAIGEGDVDLAPRMTVVAAASDPYTATMTSKPRLELACDGDVARNWRNCDLQALYDTATELPRDDAFAWRCLAANLGHGGAQMELGNYYLWGRDPVDRNYVAAYRWYSLAARSGESDAAAKLDYFAEEISDGRLAAAKRELDFWRPGPAPCVTAEGAG